MTGTTESEERSSWRRRVRTVPSVPIDRVLGRLGSPVIMVGISTHRHQSTTSTNMNATALFNTLLSTSPICLIPSETAASGCSFGVHNPRIVALTVGLTSLVLILLSFGQSQDESVSSFRGKLL